MSLKLGILASFQQQAAPLLLDVYPGAAAAYSLRKLTTTYTGASIRVRRSSDNTETDIGFVANVLDVTTLTTFVGMGNGFVVKWYDQSGNSRNLNQTNILLQPSIIISGVLQTLNSKPCVFFNDINQNIFSSIILGGTTYFFDVLKTSDTNFILYHSGDSSAFIINVATQSSTNTSINFNAVVNSYYKNNILQTAPTTRGDVYNLISTNAQILLSYETSLTNWLQVNLSGYTGFQFSGYKQELIIYNSNQASNLSGINSNINSFYTIY
jgi:hypothetical protein